MADRKQDSLDRVQQEVNRVLELLGKVFVASKTQSRGATLATANRLKQVLPQSLNNFHNALDEIEEQLQFAKLVMRRDLALIYEKTQQPPVETDAKSEVDLVQSSEIVKEEVEHKSDDVKGSEIDVDMPDASEMKQSLKLQPIEQAEAKPTNDQEKDPDTAISNNADMDSLFNDPVSAGGVADTTNGAFDFAGDSNTSNDFNFEEFSAGLGNDSGTMDGLDSFNGADDTNAEPDFSALFGAGNATQEEVNNTQTSDAHDFNFDDLMDLGFNTEDGTTNNNNNNDYEIDFT